MTIDVDLRGFRELERALAEDLPLATARAVLARTGKTALEPIRIRMGQLAPFDPQDRDEDGNHLRDTMKTQNAKAKLARAIGTARNEGVVVITGPAPVGKRARSNAGWQENGTEKMPANAYARPAIDGHEKEVIERVKVGLVDQIDKAKARIRKKVAKG